MATNEAGQRLARNLVWVVAALIAGVIAFGFVSVTINPLLAAGGFATFAAVAYATAASEDEISVTFGLSLIVVLGLVLEFLVPQGIVSRLPIAPYLNQVDVVTLTIMTVVVILFWWVLDIRFLSNQAKNPETVADKLGDRVATLFEQYVSIGRITLLASVSLGLIVLDQFGVLVGELTAIASESPWVLSNIVSSGLGYLALGGEVPLLSDVPVISEVGPQGFLIIAVLAVIIAIGVEYS